MLLTSVFILSSFNVLPIFDVCSLERFGAAVVQATNVTKGNCARRAKGASDLSENWLLHDGRLGGGEAWQDVKLGGAILYNKNDSYCQYEIENKYLTRSIA